MLLRQRDFTLCGCCIETSPVARAMVTVSSKSCLEADWLGNPAFRVMRAPQVFESYSFPFVGLLIG
jgi:hypothetical protein